MKIEHYLNFEGYKEGGFLTVSGTIVDAYGGILFEPEQKVTIREIHVREGYWSKLCPDIYVKPEVVGFLLYEVAGFWSKETFKEYKPTKSNV